MLDIDLASLSRDELMQLQKNIDKALAAVENRQRQEALNAVEAKAREFGFSLAELTGAPTPRQSKGSPPKYVHPENPELTWSGRGRQPDWLREAIAAGKSKDDFLIDA